MSRIHEEAKLIMMEIENIDMKIQKLEKALDDVHTPIGVRNQIPILLEMLKKRRNLLDEELRRRGRGVKH